MNSHSRQLRNFYQLSFSEFDVNCNLIGPFKDFQSDQIQRSSCEIFTAHYACKNADLNLTLVLGTTKGFSFQIINSLIEPWEGGGGVRLTSLDCKVMLHETIRNDDF